MVVGKGRPVRRMTRRKQKEKQKTKISESKGHIELIAMLTVEVLKSVERFNTQNTRAPAFFVTFGMRARVS